LQLDRFLGVRSENVAIGREKGEVEKDEEGLKTAWNFGKNIAFLVK